MERDFDWREGWCGLVEGQAEVFVAQLAREPGRDPVLAPAIGVGRVRAIGVAEGSDDVVYALTGEGTPFAVVHRAWLLRRLRPRMRRVPAVVPLQRLTDLE